MDSWLNLRYGIQVHYIFTILKKRVHSTFRDFSCNGLTMVDLDLFSLLTVSMDVNLDNFSSQPIMLAQIPSVCCSTQALHTLRA